MSLTVNFREPSGAVFSPCGRFRHLLWRCWDAALPTMGYCCLNPSTAGKDVEDQSSLKFRGFAERNGCGSYITSNLYDFKATDPKDLKAAGYPLSEQADHAIRVAAQLSRIFVVAWGANARGLSRPIEVLALLRSLGVKPFALALTADGIPRHPLMLPYSSELQPF